MRVKIMIVAGLALLTFAFVMLDQTHVNLDDSVASQNIDMARKPAPEVTFALLNGGKLSLHSLKGKNILLHFWASWCAPCKKEFPDLLKRVAAMDNTVLLTVSGDENADDARKFLAPYKIDSKKVVLAHDPKHAIIEGVFQTFQLPETIIINPDLTMKEKIIGVFQK